MLFKSMIKGGVEAGCDEAGRGSLAGPVYAAAVILPDHFSSELLNDSKLLSEKNRYLLRELIVVEAIDWSIGICDHREIDQLNILQASILAMHKALHNLKLKPKHIIVDGNQFNPFQDIRHTCVVKGDSKYLSMAAASILAKTFRDDHMNQLHEEHPVYHWNKNKGYPTKQHRDAIRVHGTSKYHRLSYNLLGD